MSLHRKIDHAIPLEEAAMTTERLLHHRGSTEYTHHYFLVSKMHSPYLTFLWSSLVLGF